MAKSSNISSLSSTLKLRLVFMHELDGRPKCSLVSSVCSQRGAIPMGPGANVSTKLTTGTPNALQLEVNIKHSTTLMINTYVKDVSSSARPPDMHPIPLSAVCIQATSRSRKPCSCPCSNYERSAGAPRSDSRRTITVTLLERDCAPLFCPLSGPSLVQVCRSNV